MLLAWFYLQTIVIYKVFIDMHVIENAVWKKIVLSAHIKHVKHVFILFIYLFIL